MSSDQTDVPVSLPDGEVIDYALTAQPVVQRGRGRLVPKQDETPLMWPCSFEPLSWEHRAAIMAASNPADIEIDQRTGFVDVLCVHWLVMPDESRDPETNKVSQFARTVLFDREGRTFKTSSEFAPHKLAAALEMFDKDEWQRGISFRFSLRRGKSGRTYHDMRLTPRQG